MKKTYIILFIIYLTTQVFALDNNIANQFIQNLINNSKNLSSFADKTVLEKSSRLNIKYNGYPNKWLLGYDIDVDTKKELKNGSQNYSYCITDIDSVYSKLILTISGIESLKTFYFKNNKFIFPEMYIAEDWSHQSSEFFNFKIYQPEYFNEYSMHKLDNFVYELIDVFNVDSVKVNLLKEKKIDYILCKNSNQIKEITGYDARGQFLVSSDAIITSFNCHYHEIVHFFINYVIEQNNLYTNPFILEGLAVALGGRGGKVPKVILDMGYYLQKSGFLKYNDIITYAGFYENSASMTYPVSGLYVKFLLENMQLQNFLQLYKSSGAASFNLTRLNSDSLPEDSEWNEFLKNYKQYCTIIPFDLDTNMKTGKSDTLLIEENDYFYSVWAKTYENFMSKSERKLKSRLFQEMFTDRKYNGEHFLLKISDTEISLYDLYTNNLIANYVNSFDTTAKSVMNTDGWYTFKIEKSILHELK